MVMEKSRQFGKFIDDARRLKGDEKGEAQVFLDRFFQAFGHDGYKEAGAILEHRIRKKDKHMAFEDLYWEPRLLMEMKKRGENLQKHYDQVRDYWHDTFPKPRYVVLSNFDEFWIYDFFNQNDPVDKIFLKELPTRYTAFNFMFPVEKKPLFNNDMVAVSREAADKVASVFNSLTARGEERSTAQLFVLQCVFSMFAEDFGLLPRSIFTEILNDCRDGMSSYDLLEALFRHMNNPKKVRGGRFVDVDYFNGGLFSIIEPIDLNPDELSLLSEAAAEDWSKVQPHIFGALFERSMGKNERHALGAHFTNEADIMKVVRPTIERPWKERIEQAKTLKELKSISEGLYDFKVLDPACGCGNFLYIAYREIKRLEFKLLEKIHSNFDNRSILSMVGPKQFYGIDINPFAVDLAKVTLLLAKEQSLKEMDNMIDAGILQKELDYSPALPLDNLDENIRCDDALFCNWPKADAIISNPPYQSKNKMQDEFGPSYVNKIREKYPDIPGRADYCVFWFKRAHDELEPNCRAGLVGTNTICQTHSRMGGLDYIVDGGGTIVDAVASQVWSGEAAVHVSIVNWIKGEYSKKKRLQKQIGDKKESPWEAFEVEYINSSLSFGVDVSRAKKIKANYKNKVCFQGQTHGHKAFLLSTKEAQNMIKSNKENAKILFPYLIGDELIGNHGAKPKRYVIDFYPKDIMEAKRFEKLFLRLKNQVLPDRMKMAEREITRNKKALLGNSKAKLNKDHQNALKRWWLLFRPRGQLIELLNSIPRYIACSRVTKRPIFTFVDSSIHPNDAIQTFTLSDDYSFGILQSDIHWLWFIERCSTLKRDFRYTSDTIFTTFPWPQKPSIKDVVSVAKAGIELRKMRDGLISKNKWTLRELYRTLDLPGENPLRMAHDLLDISVRRAYGIEKNENPLEFLLKLNLSLNHDEVEGKTIDGPGLPLFIEDSSSFYSNDCVKMEIIN